MVHFWHIEMEKGKIWGRHPLGIPKERETQGRIYLISTFGRKCLRPPHCRVFPYKIGWMTSKELYQHG